MALSFGSGTSLPRTEQRKPHSLQTAQKMRRAMPPEAVNTCNWDRRLGLTLAQDDTSPNESKNQEHQRGEPAAPARSNRAAARTGRFPAKDRLADGLFSQDVPKGVSVRFSP